jgi:hypothetical protein
MLVILGYLTQTGLDLPDLPGFCPGQSQFGLGINVAREKNWGMRCCWQDDTLSHDIPDRWVNFNSQQGLHGVIWGSDRIVCFYAESTFLYSLAQRRAVAQEPASCFEIITTSVNMGRKRNFFPIITVLMLGKYLAKLIKKNLSLCSSYSFESLVGHVC